MTREQKIREARRLRALGWTAPAIGRQLGVSDSTIRNWYLGGTCQDCDAFIDGSDGVKAVRCSPCRHAWETAQKVWTREAVLDAIQRWEREHGRPPSALDWLHADPDHGYPNRGSVYRSSGNEGAPFATWNDAISAAGFVPTPAGKRGIGHRGKLVLAVLADGQPHRYTDIEREAECPRSTTAVTLRLLIRRGLIVKLERGLYEKAA